MVYQHHSASLPENTSFPRSLFAASEQICKLQINNHLKGGSLEKRVCAGEDWENNLFLAFRQHLPTSLCTLPTHLTGWPPTIHTHTPYSDPTVHTILRHRCSSVQCTSTISVPLSGEAWSTSCFLTRSGLNQIQYVETLQL